MDFQPLQGKYNWNFKDGSNFALVLSHKELANIWPIVSSFLQRVLLPIDKGATVDVEHILLGIVTGSLFLFVDRNREGDIQNVAVSEFVVYPKQPVCFRILYTAGKLEESWHSKLKCLEEFAHDFNASGCEIWARRGFQRTLKIAGYSPVQIQFYKTF